MHLEPVAPDELALAIRRIRSNLGRLVVASQRTLESKISEAGPNNQRVGPHVVFNAVGRMLSQGNLIKIDGPPCALFTLPGVPAELLTQYLEQRRALENLTHKLSTRSSGRNTIGAVAERVLKDAFVASPAFAVGPGWGNVTEYDGIPIKGSADGLVFVRNVSPEVGACLIEIKNRREWLYPRDWRTWDAIRNAYDVNAVPLIFSRRIYDSTPKYVFSRVGGIGIQTFRWFAPSSFEDQLIRCARKDGLGFHDLDCSETVPGYLQRYIDDLPDKVAAARNRLNEVRHIVAPFLDDLASETLPKKTRRSTYNALQVALNAYDGWS